MMQPRETVMPLMRRGVTGQAAPSPSPTPQWSQPMPGPAPAPGAPGDPSAILQMLMRGHAAMPSFNRPLSRQSILEHLLGMHSA